MGKGRKVQAEEEEGIYVDFSLSLILPKKLLRFFWLSPPVVVLVLVLSGVPLSLSMKEPRFCGVLLETSGREPTGLEAVVSAVLLSGLDSAGTFSLSTPVVTAGPLLAPSGWFLVATRDMGETSLLSSGVCCSGAASLSWTSVLAGASAGALSSLEPATSVSLVLLVSAVAPTAAAPTPAAPAPTAATVVPLLGLSFSMEMGETEAGSES